jgi:hypothetical protein
MPVHRRLRQVVNFWRARAGQFSRAPKGFSVQRPRRVLARADTAAQDRWRRRLYPALKKKPARGTGR